MESASIPNDAKSIMTREQLRAARAILGWSQDDLAALSGVSAPTIKRLEPGFGPVQTRGETLDKLRAAFAGVGIVFHEEGGDGQLGVFYTPRVVLDAVMAAIKAPDDAASTLDPVCGTGDLISGSYPRTAKMRYLRGYQPGTKFEITKERLDKIKMGESALKHFRIMRGMTRRDLSAALLNSIDGLTDKENDAYLTEAQLEAAEYMRVEHLPQLTKISYLLGVNPNELIKHDGRLIKDRTPTSSDAYNAMLPLLVVADKHRRRVAAAASRVAREKAGEITSSGKLSARMIAAADR
jgi:transcriptional regulator with XRE-family HTH domain